MPTLDSLFHTPLVTSLLVLAAFFVGLSKGGLPGVGMLGVPVLSLVMSPINAAVLLLPIYILSDTVAVWLYRKEFSVHNLKVLIPAGFLGVAIGWATASLVSDRVVSMLIGIMGVAFCLNVWLRKSHSKSPGEASLPRGIFWGTLSGFTSFVSHAGSPPYQIYVLPQNLSKMVFAGTTTIVFAAINLAKLIPYATLHPYSRDTLEVACLLLPAALLGTVAGRFMVKWLPEAKFFLAVQIALFIICMQLISDSMS
ncbi:MAG: sulfite exporter TauE/SafE family protein [Granulosicoccus sp.]